ncbi:MAG: hypothetical protein ACJAUW_000227 [Yoonia sp.]|jgi:hypothetical protein
MKNLASPFEASSLRQTRAKARRAAAKPKAPKSANPFTRDVFEAVLATCDHSLRGIRDRAVLMMGWASGGRRRSEIAELMRSDVAQKDYEKSGLVWISLVATKTTQTGKTPKLVLMARAAKALSFWIEMAEITDGPLFRPITQNDNSLERTLSANGGLPDCPETHCNGGLSQRLCHTAWVAVWIFDAGRTGWFTDPGGHAIEPVPIVGSGPRVL